MWEWNDAVVSGSAHGLRGGSWFYSGSGNNSSGNLVSLFRNSNGPTNETFNIGFRVARFPSAGEHAFGSTAAKSKAAAPVSPQQKPSIVFRWLQTDSKGADSLIASIADKRFSADDLTQRIDQAVSGGRIKELAKYEQEIYSAVRLLLPAEKSDIPSIEAEIVFLQNGVIEMPYAAKRIYGSGGNSGTQAAGTAIYYRGNDWRVLQCWRDASEATLLLVRTANMPPLEPPHPGPPRSGNSLSGQSQIHLNVELRETAAANLAQLEKATPETSPKALDWLRKRSTLLAAANCSGGKARNYGISHRNCTGDATEIARNHRARPGFSLSCEIVRDPPSGNPSENRSPRNLGPAASLAELQAEHDRFAMEQPVHLKMNAFYRSPKEMGENPGTEFISNLPMKVNIPHFIKPTTEPPDGSPARILEITPTIEIIR